MRCTNCGCELPEGAKFCFNCGAKQPEENAAVESAAAAKPAEDEPATVTKPAEAPEPEPTPVSEPDTSVQPYKFCPYCGVKNDMDAVFCFACGKNMDMVAEETSPAIPLIQPQPAPPPAAPKKKSLVKLFAAAAAIVVVAVILIKVLGSSSGGDHAYVAYLKDGRVSQMDLDNYKKEPFEYSGSFGASEAYKNGYITADVRYSKDGSYIFYPSNVESGDSGQEYTLNMQRTGKDEDAVKIDNFVSRYTVLENNKVIYIKSGSNTLYVSDSKDNKEKIASDVHMYYVDDDEENIVWTEKAGANKISVYQQELSLKKDKQKLADEVDTVLVGDDLGRITFMNEDILYVVEDFQEKEKISSGVLSVVSNNEDGVYYVKETENKLMAADLVDDDCADQDRELTEPQYEDFKTETVEKNAFTGKYEKRETTDYDAYNEAYDKYRGKLRRDEMREELDEYEISNQAKELYRYKDGEEELVDEAFGDSYSYGNLETMIYSHYDLEDIPKVNLSDLDYIGDVESKYYESLVRSMETCICVEENVVVLDEALTESFAVDEDSQKGYGLKVEKSESEEGGTDNSRKTLMSFTIGSKADGKCETIAEDVYSVEGADEGRVYYMTDVRDNSGVLYCDDTEVDSDVQMYTLNFVDDIAFYAVDFNDSRQCATLKMYDGKRSTLIADDVYQYKAFEPDKVALLTDYSLESYRGSLEFYRGKEDLVNLDEDVRFLFGGKRIFR